MSDNLDRNDLTRAEVFTVRLPFGKLKIFNQHDTPPALLFMQGSCIIEVMFINGQSVPANMSFEGFQAALADLKTTAASSVDEEQARIGHIKIVDGSGEMLYRFDNNNKESLSIALTLARNGAPLGDFSLGIVGGEFEVGYPASTKLGTVDGDDAMNKERIRFRCLDAGSEGDIDITGVRVQKVTNAGMIPLYSCVFRDLKKDGAEVKVMLWFEPHDNNA